MLTVSQFIIRQEHGSKQSDKELEKLKEKEEAKRNEVVEAKKETSSIDKLKEKKFKEYEKAVQKEDEQLIEEFVTTRRAMAKIMG